MKKVIYLVMAVFGFTLTSCETVQSGHKGVEVSWGGETNMSIVHPEGMNSGFHWLWDDIVEYDVREKTIVHKFEFNDKNNMVTKVEISLDYNLNPDKVNLLHTRITDVETKIVKTLKSAGKEVVPQYSAVELNITKRQEAEDKLNKILAEELPEFFVELARVQMTDVDIPAKVANLAEQTAVQLGQNELATKKEAEQVSLAKAAVAKAKGVADAKVMKAKSDYEAAQYEAKAKKLLSTPANIKLMEAEADLNWSKKGISKYGSNNMYGVSSAAVIKSLK
jgi:regulator of protease activity HflC (stomatin/prohibitin superfamily)